MKIITNNVPRDLTPKEREWFDYIGAATEDSDHC